MRLASLTRSRSPTFARWPRYPELLPAHQTTTQNLCSCSDSRRTIALRGHVVPDNLPLRALSEGRPDTRMAPQARGRLEARLIDARLIGRMAHLPAPAQRPECLPAPVIGTRTCNKLGSQASDLRGSLEAGQSGSLEAPLRKKDLTNLLSATWRIAQCCKFTCGSGRGAGSS